MESIQCLKGKGPPDLEELVVTEGGLLLLTSKGVVVVKLHIHSVLNSLVREKKLNNALVLFCSYVTFCVCAKRNILMQIC